MVNGKTLFGEQYFSILANRGLGSQLKSDFYIVNQLACGKNAIVLIEKMRINRPSSSRLMPKIFVVVDPVIIPVRKCAGHVILGELATVHDADAEL